MSCDNEQISMFVEPEKAAYLKIRPTFLKILKEDGIAEETQLNGAMRKSGYFSVTFSFPEKDPCKIGKKKNDPVVFQIYRRKKPFIAVPEHTVYKSEFMRLSSGTISKNPVYIKFPLPSCGEIELYRDLLTHVFNEVLDTIPKEFDCCSRVEQCSDAKMCIHPDKKLAFKCGYRRILKGGRVFFGKNRNVV